MDVRDRRSENKSILIHKFRPEHILVIPEHLIIPTFLATRIIRVSYSIPNSERLALVMLASSRQNISKQAMRSAQYHFAASSRTVKAQKWLPDLTFDVVGCGYEQDIFFKKTDTPYKHGRIIFNGNLKRRKGFRVLQNAS